MSGVLDAIQEVGPALTQALAWFVLQGFAIGVLALVVGGLMRRRSAHARYTVHVSAMVLMLLCLPVNLLVLSMLGGSDRQSLVTESNAVERRTAEPESALEDDTVQGDVDTRVAEGFGDDPPWALPPSGHVQWPQGVERWELESGVDGYDSVPAGRASLDESSAWVPPPFDVVLEDQQTLSEAGTLVSVSVHPTPTHWQRLSPWVVGIYFVGLVVFLLRLLAALRGGQQLRRAAVSIDRKGMVWSLFKEQAKRLGIPAKRRPAVALLPDHLSATGPLLIGLIKPVVLLPAAAVTQLTPAQLEAVIAHELAHLKRYDPWVLLLQRVIETLLFFHPMVWVISGRVSTERENACDDMVLAMGAKPADYASALVMFLPVTSAAKGAANRTPAIAAAAVSSSRSLRQRILRLFGEPTSTPVRLTRKGLAACAVMVLLSTVMVVLACQSTSTPRNGAGFVSDNEGVAQERVAETVVEEDRLYWSMSPVANGQPLRLDGPAGDAWPLMADDSEGLFDKHAVYAVILNESDWHTLSPEELIAVVDATADDQRPSHLGKLFAGETIASTPGLPGEQVYQTRVVGYRTSNDTYGMVRVEDHPFAAYERLAKQDPLASGYGAETSPRYAQVKRVVEEPDRFDIGWDQSIPALDLRAGDPELAFLGDNLLQKSYDSRFAAEAGATYVLTARSAVGMSALEVFQDDGRISGGQSSGGSADVLAKGHDRWYDYIRSQGVTEPSRDRCIRLVWTAPADGTYTARVRFEDRGPDRHPKRPNTGGYTLDVRCLTTRPKASPREADAVPYDAGAIQRIELAGTAVMHQNSPPRLGLYYLPDTPEASFRLFDLLVVSGFDLNQVPYHRFDVLRRDRETGKAKRLIDVPVFFAWQLGRGVMKTSEPTALQPGDKVVFRPRDLYKREEAKNLNREALGWGLPVEGLMCRWKHDAVEIQPGQQTVPLTVQVRNVSDRPVVWHSHWQVGRLSRDEMAIALFEESPQPTSRSVVGRWEGGKVRYAYQRGGRMASELEAKHGSALTADAARDLPGGRVHYRTGTHFLSPGAIVEMRADYPLDRLARVGGDGFAMPDQLFAEVYRYDPIHGPNRPLEFASMTGPPLVLRVLPGEADTLSGLGPVIERDMSRREQYLDLDTAEYVDPASLNGAAEWGMWMIGTKGHTDGRVNLYHSVLSSDSENLSGRHVEFVPLDALAFEKVTAKDIEACWDEAGLVAAGRTVFGGLRGITTRDGPHAFRTLAGKRGVVELVKAEDGPRQWMVRIRYLPGNNAPATQPGDAVEGVSLHLHDVRYRTQQRIKQTDGTTRPGVTFNLRARHDGSRKLHLPENPRRYQLCVDGVWYAYVLPNERIQDPAFHTGGKLLEFSPMAIPQPFAQPITRVLDNGYWYAIPQGEEDQEAKKQWGGGLYRRAPDDYGDPLVLTPGEHTVHIAITFGPVHFIEGPLAVRAVSNPMTINVPGKKEARVEPVKREAWHQLLTDVAQDKIDLKEATRRAEKIAATGLDPDTQDNRGFRPLPDLLSSNHWWYDKTTPEERLVLVRLLIKHGADPDLTGAARSLPPLHLAADNFEPEMVRLLGELGADPNRRVGLIAGEWGTPLHRVAWYIGSRYRVNRTEENLAKLQAKAIPTIEALLEIGADPWLRAYTRGALGAGGEIQTPIDLCPLGRVHDLLLAVVEEEYDRLQAEVTTFTAELLQAVLDKDADTLLRYLHDNPERGYFVLQNETSADSVIRHFRENQYLLDVDQIDTEALFDHVYTRPDVASVLLRTEATNSHVLLVLFHDGRRWGLSWIRSIPGNLDVREAMQMRMLASVGGALDHRNRPWLDAQRYKSIDETPPLLGGAGVIERRRETNEIRVTVSPKGGLPSIVFLKADEPVDRIRLLDEPGEHLLLDVRGRGVSHVREVRAHDWFITRDRIVRRGSTETVAWDAAGQLFVVDSKGRRHAVEKATVDLKTNQLSAVEASEPVKRADAVRFGSGENALYEGVGRREAAQLFRAVLPWSEQQRARPTGRRDGYWLKHRQRAEHLADLLDQMAEEDDAWQEPANLDALPQDELIAYHIYHLREIKGQPATVPGKVNVLGGFFNGADQDTNAPARALRDIAKPAIPALIELLDDERPIRCISTGLNGLHVLRYRDAAEQILSKIAGKRFMPHVNRGIYFSNAPEDVQQQVVKDINQWWANNRERDEADWLRDAIQRDGIGARNSGDDRAERLIQLEGLASLDLFRQRLAEEPGYGNVVRVFWTAANCEGPADPAVLDEIREVLRGQHLSARLAACRILQRHGTEADQQEIAERLVQDVHAVAEIEDWDERERGSDLIIENLFIRLCYTRSKQAFDAACGLLAHKDPRVVDEILDGLTNAYKPELGPALAEDQLEQLTQGLHNAIRVRHAEPDAMPHLDTRYEVVLWLHKQHRLWPRHRIDVSMDGPRPTDAQKEQTIANVLAWFSRREVDRIHDGVPEKQWLHDNGVTITGRVLDKPDGEPAAGVRVALVAEASYIRRWAVTDEHGRYTFDRVPATGGVHRLQVGRHGPGAWTDEASLRIKAFDARFGEDRLQADDLFAVHPNIITGRVIDAETGEGVPNERINVRTGEGRGGVLATDGNGRYRIHTVATEVTVRCARDSRRYYEPLPQAEGDQDPSAQAFSFKPGESIEAVDFKLQPAPRYSMRFVMPDGSPAQGLEVYVLKMYRPVKPLERGHHMANATMGNEDRVATDKHGRMAGYLRSVHGQKQNVEIHLTVIARTADRHFGVTRKIVVNGGDPPPTDLELALEPCGSATFRVVGPGQEVEEGPSLSAQADYRGHNVGPLPQSAPWFMKVGVGRYRAIGLLPGWRYGMCARAEGYRTERELWVDVEAGKHVEAGDLDLKWWGIKAVPGLIEQLQHADSSKRESACRSLGQLGTDAVDAIEQLIALLKNDPKNTVRFSAAEALGEIGPKAKAAVPDLIDALENDGLGVPREAAVALGLIGDPSAIPVLVQAAQSEDRSTRHAAITSLGQLAGPDAIVGLSEILRTHPISDTRRAAIHALAQTRSRSVLPLLRKAAQADKRGPVREAAEAAIKKVQFETRSSIGNAR